MSLNVSGFCYTKGSYVGQSEIFRKVIEESLQPKAIKNAEEYLRNGANKDVKRLLSSEATKSSRGSIQIVAATMYMKTKVPNCLIE